MIAGAPGAFGSPVIFDSSGVMGNHSSALTSAPKRAVAPAQRMATNRKRRLERTMTSRCCREFSKNDQPGLRRTNYFRADRDVEGSVPWPAADLSEASRCKIHGSLHTGQ